MLSSGEHLGPDRSSRSPNSLHGKGNSGSRRSLNLPIIASVGMRTPSGCAATFATRSSADFLGRCPMEPQSQMGPDGVEITIATEPGIRLGAVAVFGKTTQKGTAIILSAGPKPDGEFKAKERGALDAILRKWRQAGHGTLELSGFRGTGRWLANIGPVAGVRDHTPAEWGLWVNRPLLGQWVWDIMRWLDLLDELKQGKGLSRTCAAESPVRPGRARCHEPAGDPGGGSRRAGRGCRRPRTAW